MHLIVDHREGALKEMLDIEGIEFRNLDLGDVVIQDDARETLLVIERKSLQDLSASIKDGRYKSQKERLMSAYQKHQICYVIEGMLTWNACPDVSISGIPLNTIHSCILNTTLRDGIRVICTRDLKDTRDLILQIYMRMTKDPASYSNQTPKDLALQTSGGVVPPQKRHSKEDVYISQLCQIPGVSLKTARAIEKRYSNMRELLAGIVSQGPAFLSDLKIECNGKHRAFSKTIIANIISSM